MAWIEPEALKPYHILQFFSVPVSVFLTWRVFAAGKNQERVKHKLSFLVDQTKEIESELGTICGQAETYYSKSQTQAERRPIEIELNSRLGSLQRKLPRLAVRAGLNERYFLEEFMDLKMLITGGETGFQSSKLKPRKIDDPLFGKIQNARQEIVNCLEDIRDKCFTPEKGSMLRRILIWIAVVVAILFFGFLLYIGLSGPREPKQPIKVTQIVLAETKAAVERFYSDCKKFPNSLYELVAPPKQCGAIMPYLKGVMIDGWGRPLKIEVSDNTIRIISLGEDDKAGGDGKSSDLVEVWEAPGSTSQKPHSNQRQPERK